MPDPRDPAAATTRIACIQMEPVITAVEANVARSLALLDQAAARGAVLAVLPELCNTGYVFASREEALALAEPVPDGPTTGAWAAAARRHGLHVVAGIAERDGDRLYNSAVVVGPDGPVGTFRKNHLWGDENRVFDRGDRGFPVFDTPLGRIAVAICYDIWFPETFRLAALQGADVLCVPTNWVPMPGQPDDAPLMANVLAMAGAHANALCVAAADRIGTERGQPFLGRSLILDHTGWPAAGPASADGEEIVIADVSLADPRRRPKLNAFNHVVWDRRTDLYDGMLGTGLAGV
ncbi:nitrilase family protein [Azospirillum sp. ST 5-10]|uniref:nitrilase family protein n=1 Tax=unclassified Azospirillum TaxID=2630922 RepID=UPI003F4A76F3